MPGNDVQALYLLVGEVKGQLVSVLEQQVETRRANSAINVTISAQSTATATLAVDIRALTVTVISLESQVAILLSRKDRESGFVSGIKAAWAVLVAGGVAFSGFVGWMIGYHGQKPW